MVSIHVPVKDTTFLVSLSLHRLRVSIHVPVKDTTYMATSLNWTKQGFNPRTRKGYDLAAEDGRYVVTVSIHVPVKDTTACLPKALFITLSANDSANNDIRQ